jgi:ribosomal protein L11 methyltransferase
MNWMEVSLSVNGELAEAVADVLARFAPNGVVTEQGVKYRDEEDEGTGDGPITVCAYLPADEQLHASRRSIEEALEHLRMIQPLPSAAFKLIPDQNWMEAWKRHYRPIPVGRRLIIVPAWLDQDQGERVAIKIDPGMAFGTGTHPTTQLCLELLEEALDWVEPKCQVAGLSDRIHIIDVGCGSGILSIAALKLGAAAALGVDIDAQAIENARHNARINGVGHELTLAAGSVQEILAGQFSVRSAELVLANILAPVIIRLLDAGLGDLVAPGGSIVLSGILQDQAAGVVAAAEVRGLHLKAKHNMQDWIALQMIK